VSQILQQDGLGVGGSVGVGGRHQDQIRREDCRACEVVAILEVGRARFSLAIEVIAHDRHQGAGMVTEAGEGRAHRPGAERQPVTGVTHAEEDPVAAVVVQRCQLGYLVSGRDPCAVEVHQVLDPHGLAWCIVQVSEPSPHLEVGQDHRQGWVRSDGPRSDLHGQPRSRAATRTGDHDQRATSTWARDEGGQRSPAIGGSGRLAEHRRQDVLVSGDRNHALGAECHPIGPSRFAVAHERPNLERLEVVEQISIHTDCARIEQYRGDGGVGLQEGEQFRLTAAADDLEPVYQGHLNGTEMGDDVPPGRVVGGMGGHWIRLLVVVLLGGAVCQLECWGGIQATEKHREPGSAGARGTWRGRWPRRAMK